MRIPSCLALVAIISCTPQEETEDAKVAPAGRPVVGEDATTTPVATVDVLIATLREAVKSAPTATGVKAWRWSEGTGARVAATGGEKILSCSVKGAEVLCQTVAYAPLGEPQDGADGGGGDDHDDHDDHDHDGDDDDLPPIDPDDGDGGGGDPDGDGGNPPSPRPNPPNPPSPRPNPPPGPGPKPVPCRWV